MICKGKRRYANIREAMHHLQWLNGVSKSDKVPNRPYLCPECNKWHVTSSPKHK